jgi:quinol monooxygenase YgiN
MTLLSWPKRRLICYTRSEMSRPVHILATFEAKPGREKDVEAVLRGLIDPTHQEEGCICYLLQRRMDRPGTFYLVEKWRSAADLRKHLASPHLSAAMARKDELFAVLDVAFVSPVAGGDPGKADFKP